MAVRSKRTAKGVAKRPRARLEVDERRAQLVELGLAAFSERSYEEVAIDDIARAAGISKGLLYHYFPTKRHFYLAALEEAAAQLLAETEPDESASPEERLRTGLETYLSFVERRAKAYVALMRGGIGSDAEVFDVLERTRAEFVKRFLAHVPKKLVTPLLQTALRGWIGMVEALALEWISRRAVSADEIVTLAQQALFGLVASLTPGTPIG